MDELEQVLFETSRRRVALISGDPDRARRMKNHLDILGALAKVAAIVIDSGAMADPIAAQVMVKAFAKAVQEEVDKLK